MWRINKIFISIALISGLVPGMAQYGNEWIDFNQDFYKIKIARDGLYRITAQELEAAGIRVNEIGKTQYQLFRRGKELAIYVHDANGDQIIEYLEFYGEKNDGKMDTELYVSADAQPHTYYSLFTDTASYFLTWKISSQTSPKRMQSSNDRTSGLTPAAYHLQDSLSLQVSRYSAGPSYGSGNEIKSAIYDFGEGWTGSAFGKNQFRTFNFSLSSAVRNNSPEPQIKVLLTGGNNLEHLVDISVGPNVDNLRSVGQASFKGQLNYLFTSNVRWSDVSGLNNLVVKVTALGLEGQAERVSIGYVKCDFPQEFSYSENSDQEVYQLEEVANQRGFVVIPTTEAGSLGVLDVSSAHEPMRLAATVYDNRLEVVYPAGNGQHKLLVVKEPKPVGTIAKVGMDQMNLASVNYLIVSDPVLNREIDGVQPITDYAAYRSGTAGGGYKVLIAHIENIFDQFNFGDPSPLAVKKFLAYAKSVTDPKYLFLIGKGTSTNYNYYRQDPATTSLIHFIPTYGHPGSDLLFSVGSSSNEELSAIPTGRLNAFENKDIKAYLDKVKEMEAQPFDALWRKNLVQLSGGKNVSERSIYANYIRQFASVAEGNYLGGKAININKESNNAVQVIDIASEINNGVGLVTFFGHSASSGTDIEIGKVSNSDQGYQNAGKYPVFLVNGCNAGEIFGANVTTDKISFGEDWMKTANRGALGFIANSDFALSLNLKRYSDLFFQVAFAEEEFFGSTVGEILLEVSKRYLKGAFINETDFSQVYQTVMQGDPAIKVFGAKKPDYHLVGEELYASTFDGKRVLASADSFKLNLIVKNYGKTVNDSLKVKVERTLSDGKVLEYEQKFFQVLRHDTLEFTIYNNKETLNEGVNSFLIKVDPDNEIPELQENNNNSGYKLFLPKGSTIHLFPIAFATVNTPQVKLVWQSADQLEQNRDYTLEVDTMYGFNSPFKSSVNVNGKLLLSENFDFSTFPDSTTIYWRTRYAEPKGNEDTLWVLSSFTLIAGTTGGWGQFDRHQLEENSFVNVTYDPVSGKLNFQETGSEIRLITHGPESGLAYSDYQVIVDGVNFLVTDNQHDPECKKKNSINAVFFDRESALPYRPFDQTSGDLFNDLVCGRIPQMIYNMNRAEVVDPNGYRYLDSLIGKMKERDMVLLFSFGEVAYSEWDDRIKASLKSVGIPTSTIENLVDGQPVIFLGKKGAMEGDAVQVISNGSGIPLKEQVLDLLDLVSGKFSSGNVNTGRIGPAKKWNGFSYSLDADEANDIFGFNVYGITSAGSEQSVFSGSRIAEIDLSQVDAAQYPYLRVNLGFSDVQDQTPPQLKNWAIHYDLPPEGFLAGQNTKAEEVEEGQELSRDFIFSNLTDIPFTDSLTVNYTQINLSSGVRQTNSFKIRAPGPGDSIAFETPIQTRGKVGKNNLIAQVQANERELYLQNNSIIINEAFTVNADKTNPVLDVTFDGGYILDGDIVSPSPNILIRFKDENQYLHKEDTSGIRIDLKSPCEGCDFERVRFTSAKVAYTPAGENQDFEINYSPGPLEDGKYSLRVQGTDESGNASGEYPYEITFEVINESTITHFYPYPNPFSTSTKFVFTLTGSIVPSELKIQIMTVSGRVVREITQDEIGPLRIGNNITQYAWDGRDEYGDQLANGVYLYKVFIKKEGTPIKHRNTSADRGFKHGFGKLYILR